VGTHGGGNIKAFFWANCQDEQQEHGQRDFSWRREERAHNRISGIYSNNKN